MKKFNEKDKLLKRTLQLLDNENDLIYFPEYAIQLDERPLMGAAEFLLHPKVQDNVERVLLEGGPGQGKSTISQYVSQIHRVKLLNKVFELNSLPDKIKNTPCRLPFKIDLRHIASWVENKNPYQDDLNEEYFKNNWSKSLESFLVGHIFSHSKLSLFTTSDLIAIFKISPILLVFDGFDEIANIQMRSEVIDFINKGIVRISTHAKSIQVIVTSRPAAFLDSVGFSIDNYPHFELTDINAKIISEYLEKWIKASDLNNLDAKDLRKLVKDKLEMPHLKDLAKSPMQLAILISLLRTKGQSLPNKRTALYDNYIELFFDRESEKNTLILNKRDLIIEIHQYLAWVLHSEAELLKNSGNIHIDDLRIRVKEYLSKEGHDTSLADQLFNVMKERVCALVSRVQGTFEFEVQPLREYFCAKYLYKTAPHSDAGSVKTGTKPERLHAILRNFYWQNVVRFFTGCADRGELDMIIQELKDLQNDDLLKFTDYPRVLTSQILSDYVFTQTPLKLTDVVKIILNGISIGNIINQRIGSSNNELIQLPVECGRTEVIDECFQQLLKFPNNDYANELIGIINNNPINTQERWENSLKEINERYLNRWLEYGYKLQLIHKIDESTLLKFLETDNLINQLKRIQILIDGNRFNVVESKSKLKEIAFKGVLNGDVRFHNRKSSTESLKFLSTIFHPYFVASIFIRNGNHSFLVHISSFFDDYIGPNSTANLYDFVIKDWIDDKISQFVALIKESMNTSVAEFKTNLKPWDNIVESGRVVFKDSQCIIVIAIIAAGIRSKQETYEEFSDLHNTNLSLCKRVRCARMKSGNVNYWDGLLDNKNEAILTLMVLFCWASPKTICHLSKKLTDILNSMDSEDYYILRNCLSNAIKQSYFNQLQQNQIEQEFLAIKNNERIMYLLSLRIEGEDRFKFVYENISDYTGVLRPVIRVKLDFMINLFMKTPNDTKLLLEIKEVYKNVNNYDDRFSRLRNSEESIEMSFEVAKEIMANCKDYPKSISSMAERSCRIYANSKLIPIGKIAENENWFNN